MSRASLVMFVAVALLTGVWAAGALIGHVVRLDNQTFVQMIRKTYNTPDRRAFQHALAEYRWAQHVVPCNAALSADYAVLEAYEADSALLRTDDRHAEDALADMHQVLIDRLACTPRDGKAWLDIAMLQVVREGITPQALTAYRMSALATPGESWLAKKRLEFALAFLPVLTKDELTIARADLAVLERAHPNNMLAIQESAQVSDKQALYALFGATVPSDTP